VKKLLIITAIVSFSIMGKTPVRILEDNSVVVREGDVVKITLQQTFADVPSVPCVIEYVEKEEISPDATKWEKTKFFFKNIYRGLTWKRCAYGLGGVVVAGLGYKMGKKARREHYGHRAFANVKGWFHKK